MTRLFTLLTTAVTTALLSLFWLLQPTIAFQPVRNNSGRPATQLSSSSSSSSSVTVALTREDGKNDKLRQALSASTATNDLHIVELPCIQHADGPDSSILPQVLQDTKWDYIVVTSPEAARVLGKALRDAVPPPIAAVGKATATTLRDEIGLEVAFLPTKATAATLVKELPGKAGCKVLYPASCQAADTLQSGLEERSFLVTRLNTYDTETATWTDEQKEAANGVDIVTFASPSSVKGWLQHNSVKHKVLAACIGETSAEACRSHWVESDIYYPDKPGLEGWVEVIEQAAAAVVASRKPQEATNVSNSDAIV